MKKIGEFVYIPENNQIRKLCIVETFMDHGAFKFYYKAIDVTPTTEIELRAIKVYDVDACFNNPWYAYYALRKQLNSETKRKLSRIKHKMMDAFNIEKDDEEELDKEMSK